MHLDKNNRMNEYDHFLSPFLQKIEKLVQKFLICSEFTKLHRIWKLQKFAFTNFWQKFREINEFSAECTLFSRNFSILHNCGKTTCGNYGNSLSHFFGKKFVKVIVLLKKLLSRIFFFNESKFFSFAHSTVQCAKMQNFFSPKKNFVKSTM